MSVIRIVVLVALAGTCSFTFLLLACALPQYGVWWPMFVLIFYLLTPIPVMICATREIEPAAKDLCTFITTVLIFSAYALPILLARAPYSAPAIKWGACALTVTANTFMFATIFWVIYLTSKDD
ncbi:Leptin receptor overlapping transcript [Fasciola hepatica]|uniref:Leptin receptor overlapping transcript n=1 Tax=Fasciola hepatica TaxID=6192 RepID=A0A2H1CW05_FASHE|nr:Leptin receptor overlapping transcript [Fasciola hepatica]